MPWHGPSFWGCTQSGASNWLLWGFHVLKAPLPVCQEKKVSLAAWVVQVKQIPHADPVHPSGICFSWINEPWLSMEFVYLQSCALGSCAFLRSIHRGWHMRPWLSMWSFCCLFPSYSCFTLLCTCKWEWEFTMKWLTTTLIGCQKKLTPATLAVQKGSWDDLQNMSQHYLALKRNFGIHFCIHNDQGIFGAGKMVLHVKPGGSRTFLKQLQNSFLHAPANRSFYILEAVLWQEALCILWFQNKPARHSSDHNVL